MASSTCCVKGSVMSVSLSADSFAGGDDSGGGGTLELLPRKENETNKINRNTL